MISLLGIYEQLNESFKNFIHDDERKELYKDEVFNMLQKAYSEIGGIKGSGFRSPDDMVKNIPFWKLGFVNSKLVAVQMYKDKNGRKRVAIATDGTQTGKSQLKNMLIADYKTGRSFGEVSDSALGFIKKIFNNDISAFSIPVDVVKKLLPDDEIIPIDDYYYKREIGGHLHTKIMLGNPNAPKITRKM